MNTASKESHFGILDVWIIWL